MITPNLHFNTERDGRGEQMASAWFWLAFLASFFLLERISSAALSALSSADPSEAGCLGPEVTAHRDSSADGIGAGPGATKERLDRAA